MEISLKEFCKGCFTDNLPPCIIQNLKTKINLNDLINDIPNYKIINSFVCPILAQTFNNNKLDFLDSCLNCNLCLSFCCKNKLNISSLNLLAIEDHLFKNICNLAILISKFSEKKFEVFLEVKTDGNSRNKRIDLVCINNATIVLIKVIKSKEDFGKYERSYNSIIDKLHTHKNVKVIFLKKSSIKENYKFSNTIFECTSINNLYNLLINLKGEI